MKKIYYTVKTTDKNGIENTAIFDTLEEAKKCFCRGIECDDYLATSYLNKNTETELDVEVEQLFSYKSDRNFIFDSLCNKQNGYYRAMIINPADRKKRGDIMLIPLTEWAKRVGIHSSVARRKASKGLIPAQKIGRDWLIEENIPNTDNRIRTGKYINWRRQKTTQ